MKFRLCVANSLLRFALRVFPATADAKCHVVRALRELRRYQRYCAYMAYAGVERNAVCFDEWSKTQKLLEWAING